MLLAVGNDFFTHGGALCVLQKRNGAAGIPDPLQIRFIVAAVRLGLAGEAVGIVAGDGGQDFLLHDAVNDIGLARSDQLGDENVAAVDDDRDVFLVASAQDADQTVEDRCAGIFIIDIGVVDPEAVDTFFAQARDQLIDHEILPGFFGYVDPLLVVPVCVVAKYVLFKALVIWTVFFEGADADVGVDLAAAAFELFDLGSGVMLCVDDNGFIVFDFRSVSVQGRADENAPGGRLRGCLDGHFRRRKNGQNAQGCSQEQGRQTSGR